MAPIDRARDLSLSPLPPGRPLQHELLRRKRCRVNHTKAQYAQRRQSRIAAAAVAQTQQSP